MENPIEFIGITFRSLHHLYWFQFSIIILLISVLTGIFMRGRNLSPDDQIFYLASLFILVLAYAGTGIYAYFATDGGTINGYKYSIDCIWFNPLVSLGHIIIGLAIFNPRKIKEIIRKTLTTKKGRKSYEIFK